MIRAILPTATGLLFIATSSPAWADHPVVGGGVSHGSPIVTIAADTLPQGVLAGGIQDRLKHREPCVLQGLSHAYAEQPFILDHENSKALVR